MPSPHPPAPANFDCLARPYRLLEYLTLGPLLHLTRTTHLPALAALLPPTPRALILGDGDGRFTARLLTRLPTLRAHAVDLSPAMLRLLTRRADRLTPSAKPRLHTTCTDVRTLPTPRPSPHLITTHFLLDCLPQPEVDRLIARLAPTLPPGGLWLLSEFRIPPGPLHRPAHLLIRSLYLAFRLLTGLRVTDLPDHTTPLTHAGLCPIAVRRRLFGILTAELWQKP